MRIFVYGTLMRGESNHSLLNEEYSEYIGSAITARGFELYDLGGFPGMVIGGNGEVIGEVYDICAFTRSRLDQLEGHPQFYKRHIIKLQGGEAVEAYILAEEFTRGRSIIRSGNWRER